MSVTQKTFRSRCLMGGAMLVWPLLVAAAPPSPPPGGGMGSCDTGFRAPPPGPHGPPGLPMGPRFGRFGDEGDADRPPPFLMDLTLSEDQQDKVFAILHAAAPALRDQDKALRKARDAMRELVRSAQFNDGSAATLSQAQGKAASQLALLRTRVEHDIYSLLTADQQAQIVNRERDWQSHRREAPHPRS